MDSKEDKKYHNVLYTSDLHGNEHQYQKFVDYAIKTSVDSIIIGGDIAPKEHSSDSFIQNQRQFLKYKLPKLLNPLKVALPDTKLFLMMGNDDCAVNMEVLERHECCQIASGNHNGSDTLAVLDFDLYAPQEAKRIMI